MTKRAGLFGAAILATTAHGALAQAQDTSPTTTPATEAAATSATEAPSTGGVEDIVVTAQRREQRLQDVPLTVTALSANTLLKQGATNTYDLPNAVPGLLLSRASTVVQPFLRGVGTQAIQPGNDPSIAVYVDGVYNAAPVGLLFSFNNIERVEVLKGPQGTLFGRNATGGLIHIVTRDPTERLTAKLSAGIARFGAIQTSAYFSGGSDLVAADLSIIYNKQSNGWGRNLYKPGDAGPLIVNGQTVADPPVENDAGILEEVGIRSKVVITPSDRAKIKFSAAYLFTDTDQSVYRHPLDGAILSANGVTPFVHDGGFYDYHSDAAWFSRAKQYLASNESSYEADFGTLKSISSYARVRSATGVPSDDTPLPGAASAISHLSYDTFTQEVQLLSNSHKSIDWLDYIVGGYYLHFRGGYDPLSNYRGNQLEFNQKRFSYQTTDSLAAYGQLTFAVTSTTHVTAGLRYTTDKIVGEQYFLGQNPYVAGGATKLGQVSGLVDPRSKHFSKLTWRFAADQKITPDILLFGSYSRGYKAGAWNHGSLCLDTPALGFACQVIAAPVKPEVLDAFEAGIKSDLFDRHLRLNLSAFHYDYKDLQVQAVVGVPPISLLTNAAQARVNGAEIEGSAALTNEFTVNFAASYLDGKYKSFPGAPIFTRRLVAPYNDATAIIDASGKRMIRSPKFTFNTGVDWTIPTGIGEFDLNASLYHNSGFFWEVSNRVREGSYNIVNAQIAYKPSDNWRFRLWAKNLTGEKYYSFVQVSSSGDQGAPAAPFTFGIAVDWSL